jgi:zinc transport system substrate-binding protein
VIIVAVLTLSACETDPLTGEAPAASTDAGATRADERLSIYTVNYPLQYFAQRIGGELVDVSFPAPQGIDPADFMPDIDTVAEYQQADIIFLNGAGYAGWIRRMSLPASTQLDTSAAFVGQLLEVEESVVHTHGPTGDHAHDNLASTVWLNPELATEQATAVRDALARKLPDSVETLDANLAALANDLAALDIELRDAFDRLDDRPLIFSHPVYQYLDQRYGLGGKSVHWEPDVEPAEDELNALAGLTGGVMFWEAEPLPATHAALQAMGISSVVFDPCAGRPETGDYLAVMSSNIRALVAAL